MELRMVRLKVRTGELSRESLHHQVYIKYKIEVTYNLLHGENSSINKTETKNIKQITSRLEQLTIVVKR